METTIATQLKALKKTADKKALLRLRVQDGSLAREIIYCAESGKRFPQIAAFLSGGFDPEFPAEISAVAYTPKPIKAAADTFEALAPLASTDATRPVLGSVYFDKQAGQAVATDGRLLGAMPYHSPTLDGHCFRAFKVGPFPKGSIVAPEHSVGNYPNWPQVVVSPNDIFFSCEVNIEKARQVAEFAELLNHPFGGRQRVKVWCHDLLFDPSYIVKALTFLVASGAKTITLGTQGGRGGSVPQPVRFDGDNGAYCVLMPLRVPEAPTTILRAI
jgi:hypothetical protein